MTKKINSILKSVLNQINPPEEDLKFIEKKLEEFLEDIKKRIKNLKIDAEVFVGGSFAKGTVIKKGSYDVDVFIRFDRKYIKEDLSKLNKKILGKIKHVLLVHGSRDYFRVKINNDFSIELIPVLKVKKPEDAENITDLSYSHVKYLNKKVKSDKILNEIKIAKAFCYANNCYGAESYIRGFSGYGLELLVYHYGSFLKFIRAVAKSGKEKVIIDIEKHHKNKRAVLMDLNSSKLQSPIILIDPTYKQRNVLAALSDETFEKFRKECKKFLKNPSVKAFEKKKVNLEKIRKDAGNKGYEFILMEVKTDRQEGDIAGSKLLKFYRHLTVHIEKYFGIKNKGFNYNQKKSSRYFFVVKSKEKVLHEGPFVIDEKNVKKFKREHRSTFIKGKRIYSWEEVDFRAEDFVKSWKKNNRKQMREMSIKGLKILNH